MSPKVKFFTLVLALSLTPTLTLGAPKAKPAQHKNVTVKTVIESTRKITQAAEQARAQAAAAAVSGRYHVKSDFRAAIAKVEAEGLKAKVAGNDASRAADYADQVARNSRGADVAALKDAAKKARDKGRQALGTHAETVKVVRELLEKAHAEEMNQAKAQSEAKAAEQAAAHKAEKEQLETRIKESEARQETAIKQLTETVKGLEQKVDAPKEVAAPAPTSVNVQVTVPGDAPAATAPVAPVAPVAPAATTESPAPTLPAPRVEAPAPVAVTPAPAAVALTPVVKPAVQTETEKKKADAEAKKKAEETAKREEDAKKAAEAKAKAEEDRAAALAEARRIEAARQKEAAERAAAEEAARAAQLRADLSTTLTAADLKDGSTIFNFESTLDGPSASKKEAKLFGMVFEACWDNFRIENTSTDKSIAKGDKQVGFKIISQPTEKYSSLKDCMSAMKAKSPSCGVLEFKCRSISEKGNSTLAMAKFPSVQVGLISENKQADLKSNNRFKYEDFELPLTHRSQADLNLDLQTKRKEREARIYNAHLSNVESCRGSKVELAKAKASLMELRMLGLSTEDYNRFKEELVEAELANYAREALGASAENLGPAVERLKAFGARNCAYANKVAGIIRQVSMNQAKTAKRNPEALGSAQEILAQAQAISCINDQVATKLENDQRDLAMAEYDMKAAQGFESNPQLAYELANLQFKLAQDMDQFCDPSNGFMSSCHSATNAYFKSMDFWGKAQAADARRNEMRQQIAAMRQGRGTASPFSTGMQMQNPFQAPGGYQVNGRYGQVSNSGVPSFQSASNPFGPQGSPSTF